MTSYLTASDFRGKYNIDIDDDFAYKLGRSISCFLNAKQFVVGGDNRLSTPALKQALINGLTDSGTEVIDIGMTGTEEMYFSVSKLNTDGGVQITASHNPIEYNGMKIVRSNSKPISINSGLTEIVHLIENNSFSKTTKAGRVIKKSLLADYTKHLLGTIELKNLKPLKILVNAGNGMAGHVITEIETHFKNNNIPIEFVKINIDPDGNFPNGVPNPLLVKNQKITADAVRYYKADLGIAWDGDFDRCFFFDSSGRFIDGYYIVGLLAQILLFKNPNQTVIYEPRLTWNTIDIVSSLNGLAECSKTGHAFIKEKMREKNAVYGGEISAHHYFRDFSFCDSGMIPWLYIIEHISCSNKSLKELVNSRMMKYPCSNELNYTVNCGKTIIDSITNHYQKNSSINKIEMIDGLSIAFEKWRFNLRLSNTEPLLRLNVETRGDKKLLLKKIEEVNSLILNFDT